jgi:hypothetical protein
LSQVAVAVVMQTQAVEQMVAAALEAIEQQVVLLLVQELLTR